MRVGNARVGQRVKWTREGTVVVPGTLGDGSVRILGDDGLVDRLHTNRVVEVVPESRKQGYLYLVSTKGSSSHGVAVWYGAEWCTWMTFDPLIVQHIYTSWVEIGPMPMPEPEID